MAPRPATIIEVPRPPSPADLGAHALQGTESVLGQVVPAAEMFPVSDREAAALAFGLPVGAALPPGRYLLMGSGATVPELGWETAHPYVGVPHLDPDDEVAEAARRAAVPADGKRARRAKSSADPGFVPPTAEETDRQLGELDEQIARLMERVAGLRVVRWRLGGEEG